MLNWKQILCFNKKFPFYHKYLDGDDVANMNRSFKWCQKCKLFRYTSPPHKKKIKET